MRRFGSWQLPIRIGRHGPDGLTVSRWRRWQSNSPSTQSETVPLRRVTTRSRASGISHGTSQSQSPGTSQSQSIVKRALEKPIRDRHNLIDASRLDPFKTGTSELDKMFQDPVFLRDCCRCAACVNPSTRQKQFESADIPENIKAKTVEATEHGMRFTWEDDIPGFGDDHVTELSLDEIADMTQRPKYAELWRDYHRFWKKADIQDDLTVIDYQSYIDTDQALLATLRALRRYGLAFVQNVPESEESVINIAKRIGPLKNTFYGYTWDVRSVPDAKNVAYTHGHLGFHMDLLYMKQSPRLQFLHCMRSSAQGGASLFVDSFRAVSDLMTEDSRLKSYLGLETHFEYDNDGHYYSALKPTVSFKTSSRRQRKELSLQGRKAAKFIDAVNYAPQFQGRQDHLQNSRTMFNRWHVAQALLKNKFEQDDMLYERQMKPGECVIFDNQRVLHARTAFVPGDAGKERWLRGAYLDSDPWMSKMKALEDKHGAEQLPERQDLQASRESDAAPENEDIEII